MPFALITNIFAPCGIIYSFSKLHTTDLTMRKILLGVLILSTSFCSLAQRKKQQETESKSPPANSIDEKTKGFKRVEGFIPFYLNESQEKIYLLITQFKEEFLYVNSLSAGIGSNDIGLDRGQLGGERVVFFDKRGQKVLMIEPNYRFRAISDNADEKRAVEEAFAQSVLWGFPVIAEDGANVLIDASDFFLQDAHNVAGRLRMSQQGSYSLDKSKSALFTPMIKNFPKNSEFEATLTFSGQPTGAYIRSVVPTPSLVTVRQHHSFVELPDSDYQPRKLDPRAGYFGISYYDYATPISEPIEKRFIARHRLKKKDPTATMSEAVEPIIYYLDRGAPEPIRSALLDGARWWNQAFEAAGYKDAFRVELMPEGADPMDVRYNLIQWVHRSTRGWSYGSSVSDPRTGEIIKGHVSLGSLRVRQDYLIAEGLLAPYENGKPVSKEMEEMAIARLRQLSAHEVGHTIGLAHSYASSSESDASVMDYPHPNVKLVNGKIDLSSAYDTKIGAWDKVAIAYGYQDFPSGTNEDEALEKIIQQSLKEGLTFLSDQDARPTGGAHPYAHLWDNGNSPTEELNRVMAIRELALKNMGENNIKQGVPMATIQEALVPMYFFHRYQTEATSKIIGGVNYRYALRGDGQFTTALVNPEEQMKALDALLATVQPGALQLPEKLIAQIPPRPLAYRSHRELISGKTDLTFDPLAAAESAGDIVFPLLFNPARAGRLVEHHARNAKQPSLEDVLDKIFSATIKASPQRGYAGAVQITVNNVMVASLLALMADEGASHQVKAIANLKAIQLQKWLVSKANATTDEFWKAHYSYVNDMIENYKKDPSDFKRLKLVEAPPGAPIGSLEEACGY